MNTPRPSPGVAPSDPVAGERLLWSLVVAGRYWHVGHFPLWLAVRILEPAP